MCDARAYAENNTCSYRQVYIAYVPKTTAGKLKVKRQSESPLSMYTVHVYAVLVSYKQVLWEERLLLTVRTEYIYMCIHVRIAWA